ncbi:hypothetical protein [Kluyvera cryocrescens]|uniref:hypothetical protein n=1 Tax=Kluyvera cryocrescens TaxID=580 RepID=UPI0028AD0E04|nr:hypothetical protein [Kluyvera cryocrescens]
MNRTDSHETALIDFLKMPESYGYQSVVYATAFSYGETRGGIVEVAFGLTASPDFVRPHYQVEFGDGTIIAFDSGNDKANNRVKSGYNPQNISSGFQYNGTYFVKIR